MYYIKLYYVNNYSFLNQTLFVAGIVSMTNILGVATMLNDLSNSLIDSLCRLCSNNIYNNNSFNDQYFSCSSSNQRIIEYCN